MHAFATAKETHEKFTLTQHDTASTLAVCFLRHWTSVSAVSFTDIIVCVSLSFTGTVLVQLVAVYDLLNANLDFLTACR